MRQASQEHLVSHVLPMLTRAYDETDARLQEEVLRKTLSLAKKLDVQVTRVASYWWFLNMWTGETDHIMFFTSS